MSTKLMTITGVLMIALLAVTGGGLARRGPGPLGRDAGLGLCVDVAEALGLTIDEYIKARREGKSIAELAEDQGLTVDELKAKLLEGPRAFVEEQLAAGRMSEAKAVYMLEVIEERVGLWLQDGGAGPFFGNWRGGGYARRMAVVGRGLARRGPGRFGRGVGMAVCIDIPEALGLTIDDYINARREGKSVAELAQDQGLTLDELKDKLLERPRAFIEEQLAAGRISEAKAAYMLEVMEERLNLFLQDGEAGPRRMYRGFGPRRR